MEARNDQADSSEASPLSGIDLSENGGSCFVESSAGTSLLSSIEAWRSCFDGSSAGSRDPDSSETKWWEDPAGNSGVFSIGFGSGVAFSGSDWWGLWNVRLRALVRFLLNMRKARPISAINVPPTPNPIPRLSFSLR